MTVGVRMLGKVLQLWVGISEFGHWLYYGVAAFNLTRFFFG